MANYKVKSGDTVSQIAKRMGVRIQDIVAANPNLADVNKIRIGQSLNIPAPKKGKNIGSQGPYGRTSQTEMNMMNRKDDSYTRGVRAKMKAGAETTPTPKKAKETMAAKSSATPGMTKAKAMMTMPKSKKSMKASAAKKAAAKSASMKPATSAMNKKLDEMRSRFRNKSYGGKMVKKNKGGGMGCGAAMRGFGAVRKS
jgi:murein DD-endopeptidase MepM/ murein hydrolase activator NlpD